MDKAVTTTDFNLYKLMLINRISAAYSMQDIRTAFAEVGCEPPCSWTSEELKAQLRKSDEDLQAGHYLSGSEAIRHFKDRPYGSKMVG